MDRRRREERLAEEERQEGHDLGDDQRHGSEHHGFCGEHEGPPGATENVALIVPVPYSALMASTPSTPIVNCPTKTPIRLVLIGSKPTALLGVQWALVSAVASALMPMPSTTVTASVHTVERTVRSFVHSDRSSPGIP